MPLYFIDTFADGIEDRDTEGIALDGPGEARALVVTTMLALCRERPKPGETRTVMVTARDERNALVYTDSATLNGGPMPGSDAAAVHRAIAAMNCRL